MRAQTKFFGVKSCKFEKFVVNLQRNYIMPRGLRHIILFLTLLISGVMNYVQAAVYSGNCGVNGNNVQWTANTTTGVLSFTGSGAMADKEGYYPSWYNYGDVNIHSSITTVTIASGITTLRNDFLHGFENVTSITIPNTVTEIHHDAFYKCTNLTTVTMSTKVKSIDAYAFTRTKITSISLPNTLTSIGDYAFYVCDELTSITLPTSVTSIGYRAFGDCAKMTDFYVSWTTAAAIPQLSGSIPNSTCKLHIPCGTGTIYRAANGLWKNFVIVGSTQYTLTCKSANSAQGTVKIGSGTAGATVTQKTYCEQEAKITAVPAAHYHFSKWNDNNTTNPRTIYMPSQNTTYTASFAIDQHTLTVNSNNTNYGTVTGGGTYNYGASVTLKATPKTGYHFVKWSDNNTNASRQITVTGNATYTATFAVNQYTLTVKTATNNTTQGTVRFAGETAGASVSGTFNHGAGVNIIATPATGYHFVKWSDNNTNANRTVYVTAGATYIATFAINTYMLTVKTATNNTTQGTVKIGSSTSGASVSAPVNHGASVTITATPATGYHFVKWDDGNTTASRSVSVTAAKTYIATFAINTYTLTVNSNNTSMGTVSGGGTYNHGASATLTATPKGCTCVFKQWNDGNTKNPRTVTVTEAKTYTAQFVALSGNCGTTGHEADVTWSQNLCDSTLTISGTGPMADWLYDSAPWYNYRESIKTVFIEDGVTTIGSYAFYFCQKLSSITLPNSVTIIGNNAFQACKNLLSLTIPSSVTSIGSSGLSSFTADLYVSWRGTDILTYTNQVYPSTTDITLHIPCGTTQDYTDKNWSTRCTISDDVPQILSGTCGTAGHEAEVTWSLNTCDSVLTISGTGAMADYDDHGPWMYYWNQLKAIVIEPGVTAIGNHAFYQCFNVKDITIPNTVTHIGNEAFYMCSISDVIIPNSVETIGHGAFQSCGNLRDIYVSWETAVPVWDDMSITNGVTLHTSCATRILYDTATGWQNYRILGDESFQITLQSADITMGQVKLGTGVAQDTVIATVHCGDSIITAIPSGACSLFQQWSDGITANPRTVSILSDTTLTAFFEPNIISGNCGTAGHEAEVTWSLNMCDSVLTISGTGAIADYDDHGPWMYYWQQMKTIVIEPGVTAIGNHAFYQCFNVKDITIPNTVTHIGNEAFYMCSISDVIIPNSVETIGHGAFQSCGNLRDIYVSWETAVPVWDDMSITNGVTLHMSCPTMAMYEAAAGWQNYTLEGDGVVTITVQTATGDTSLGSVSITVN